MFSLFKRKIWILMKLFHCHRFSTRQRMSVAYKNMRLCNKQFCKHKFLYLHNFSQHFFIKIIQIQNPYLTFHRRDIFYNLICLCFPKRKIILGGSMLLDQVHKRIHRKRIVLCGDTKLLLSAGFMHILFFQKICLFNHLSCICQELLPLM